MKNNRACTNHHVVTDVNRSEHHRVGSDVDVVADRGTVGRPFFIPMVVQ